VKRFVFSLLVLAVGAALTGCDDVGTPVNPSDTPSASVTITDIAGPTTTPPQPPVEDLPASWKLCQNPMTGSSMGYPGDWHTTSLSPSDACELFHPEPFTIPAGDSLRVALYASQSQATAAQVLAGFTDPERYTTILSEPTTAVGRPAYRFEVVVSQGAPLIIEGTRVYGYIIDRGGKAFVLRTEGLAGEPRYDNWKSVVDTAKGTLKFDH
jgi:hypothetical protein